MPNLEDLSEDDLVKTVNDFLKERKANPNCEVCGVSDWGIQVDTSGDTTALYFQMTYVNRPAFIRTMIFGCQNCGNIRLISTKIIERWMDQRSGEKNNA